MLEDIELYPTEYMENIPTVDLIVVAGQGGRVRELADRSRRLDTQRPLVGIELTQRRDA
jgi:hypothetical protein